MREKILSVLALMSISQAFAQDNLINALANNQGKDVQKYYQIKPVFAVGVTDVKDQGHSGTWLKSIPLVRCIWKKPSTTSVCMELLLGLMGEKCMM